MGHEEVSTRPSRLVGQRIGPAVRELRRREGLTLNELAQRTGLTKTTISRIERRLSDVTLNALMQLSAALEVDITYFTSYQELSTQTEAHLSEVLAEIDISQEAMPDLLELSYEAQSALLDGLQWLSLSDRPRPLRARELVDKIRTDGVGQSVYEILSSIAEFGLDEDGLCRVITQMEELPGERILISDRLLGVAAPSGGSLDPLLVFRSCFEREPANPAVVRTWAQSIRSAVRQNVERFETRMIFPLATVHEYIESGYWGPGVELSRQQVVDQIASIVETLRAFPTMKVGLVDNEIPFNLLVKGFNQSVAYVYRSVGSPTPEGAGVAFRSTRTDVVSKFREYFEHLWKQIPAERRDSEAVAQWLEDRMAAVHG